VKPLAADNVTGETNGLSPTPGRLRTWRKPSVERFWLTLIAGLSWLLAGIGLCLAASTWLSVVAWPGNILAALSSFGLGVLAQFLAFVPLARKNVRRIAQLPPQVCLFAFQAWRSYLMILFMAVLGYALRHAPLSRGLLGIIYLAVGSALVLASSVYFAEL
jgi:hypothetical protein